MVTSLGGRHRSAVPVLGLACLAAFLPVRGAAAPAAGAGPVTAELRAAVSPTPRSVRATGDWTRVAGTVRLVRGRHADPAAVHEATATLRAAGARCVVDSGAAALRMYVGEPAGRPRETDQPKGWHRALGRPHLHNDLSSAGAIDPVSFMKDKGAPVGQPS